MKKCSFVTQQPAPFLFAAILLVAATNTSAYQWNLNNNGDWNNAANWNNASEYPNGVDAAVDLSSLDITNHRNINLNSAVTLGSLTIGDSNNSHQYRLYDGTGGSMIFDVSSGNAQLISDGGTRTPTFNNSIVLNDDLEISGGSVEMSSTTTFISGSGGIIYNGTGTLSMRGSVTGQYSYTGNTVVNSGIYLGSHSSNGNLASGNLKINGAIYQGYYNAALNRTLGTGAGQFQLTGGTSAGFHYNNNLTVTFGSAGSVVQWGSEVFDPGTLLLGNTRPSGGGTGNFSNILDLNGAARTIDVTLGHSGLKWQMNGVIRDDVGGASLIKTGNGNLILTKANTFTGKTEIQGGVVTLSSTGSLASTEINVAGGATFDVSSKGGFALNSQQKITGTGTVSGAVTVAGGAILAPGNSPGTTIYTGDQTWASGGIYQWEIQDWNGTAGSLTGWDLIDITDATTDPILNITAGPGSEFIIEVTEFSLTNFDGSNQSFEILRADGGITGYDQGDFTIDVSNWTQGGDWAIDQVGSSLFLNYTIPEPSAILLGALGSLLLLRRRR